MEGGMAANATNVAKIEMKEIHLTERIAASW